MNRHVALPVTGFGVFFLAVGSVCHTACGNVLKRLSKLISLPFNGAHIGYHELA